MTLFISVFYIYLQQCRRRRSEAAEVHTYRPSLPQALISSRIHFALTRVALRARYARHPSRLHNRKSNSFRCRGVLADSQSRASHLPGENAAADRSLPQPWSFVRIDANEVPWCQVRTPACTSSARPLGQPTCQLRTPRSSSSAPPTIRARTTERQRRRRSTRT